MLDDDARRALEEEAIALVSLSRPALRFATQDTLSSTTTSTSTTSNNNNNSSSSNSQQLPHPLRRVGKTSADRSDSVKQESDSSAGDTSARAGLDTTDAAGLHRQHLRGEELYAQSPEQPQPQQQDSISMKSLLVTLKKRKLSPAPSEDAAERERLAKVLPSFRDVFEPPRLPSQAGESPSQLEQQHAAAEAAAAASASTGAAPATDPKFKCKYRTGKCSNVRALKSCGDYHNLCNYHRLRANANQRKLDRKKKVQRLQVVPAGVLAAMAAAAAATESIPAAPAATVASSSSSSSSSPASVASAAVALVAMPSSAPKPQQPPPEQPPQ